MPAGTKTERFENVKKENAVVTVEDFNYDRCVDKAREECEAEDGILVQDTAWEGYEHVPTLIMQGYGTMAAEAAEQMPCKPTHIFLQAGVGSMAAAVAGYFSNMQKPPVITIVEPDKADCVFRSAKAGERVNVDGELDTVMAGLACGEVSTVAWDILHSCADVFVSVPDEITEIGMRLLAKPVDGDDTVVSGESGAVCAGFVETVMTDDSLLPLREKLKLDKDSVVLCFSTEGATDRENWEKIVNN
jgi:diaminopropionate ammonia-lyase